MTYPTRMPPDQHRAAPSRPGDWHEQIHGRGGTGLSVGPLAVLVIVIALLVVAGMYFSGGDGDIPAEEPGIPGEPAPVEPSE